MASSSEDELKPKKRKVDDEEYSESEEEKLNPKKRKTIPLAPESSSEDEGMESEEADFPLGGGYSSDSSDGQSDKCPICLNRFDGQTLGSPQNCDHAFCLDCLQEWSKNINTCPVDRSPFKMILVKATVDGPAIGEVPLSKKEEKKEEDPQVIIIPHESLLCEICKRGDNEETMLLCDGCDLGYHCECLDPPLRGIPVEEWFCPTCSPIINRAIQGQESQQLEHHHGRRRIIGRTRATEVVRRRIQRLRGEDPEQQSGRANRRPGNTIKQRRKQKNRRKRRTKRKVRKSRKARASSKPLRPPTCRSRIAEHLVLSSNASIQNVRQSSVTARFDPLSSFSLFGNADALHDFDEAEDEDCAIAENGTLALLRPSIRPLTTKRIKTNISPSPASASNLLSNILNDQDLLFASSKNIIIQHNGNLSLKNGHKVPYRGCQNSSGSSSPSQGSSCSQEASPSSPNHNEPLQDAGDEMHSEDPVSQHSEAIEQNSEASSIGGKSEDSDQGYSKKDNSESDSDREESENNKKKSFNACEGDDDNATFPSSNRAENSLSSPLNSENSLDNKSDINSDDAAEMSINESLSSPPKKTSFEGTLPSNNGEKESDDSDSDSINSEKNKKIEINKNSHSPKHSSELGSAKEENSDNDSLDDNASESSSVKKNIKTSPLKVNSDAESDKNSDEEYEKHSDAESDKHSDAESQRHSDAESEKHTDVESGKNTDVESVKHSDAESGKNSDAEPEKHSDIESGNHSDVESSKENSDAASIKSYSEKTSKKDSDAGSIKSISEPESIKDVNSDAGSTKANNSENESENSEEEFEKHDSDRDSLKYNAPDLGSSKEALKEIKNESLPKSERSESSALKSIDLESNFEKEKNSEEVFQSKDILHTENNLNLEKIASFDENLKNESSNEKEREKDNEDKILNDSIKEKESMLQDALLASNDSLMDKISKEEDNLTEQDKGDDQPADEVQDEDFTDLTPKINISLLPRIPKKKKSKFLSDNELERKSVLDALNENDSDSYWNSRTNSYQRRTPGFRGDGAERWSKSDRWTKSEDNERWPKGDRRHKGEDSERWSKGEKWSKVEKGEKWTKGEDNEKWPKGKQRLKTQDETKFKEKDPSWTKKDSHKEAQDKEEELLIRTDPTRPLWDIDYAKRARIKKRADERAQILESAKKSPLRITSTPPSTKEKNVDKDDFFSENKSNANDATDRPSGVKRTSSTSDALFKKLKVDDKVSVPSPQEDKSIDESDDEGAANFGGAEMPLSSDSEAEVAAASTPPPPPPAQSAAENTLVPYDPCDPTSSPVPSPGSSTPPDLRIPDWEEEQKVAITQPEEEVEAIIQLPDVTKPPPNFPCFNTDAPWPGITVPPPFIPPQTFNTTFSAPPLLPNLIPPPILPFPPQQQALSLPSENNTDLSIQVVDMELESPTNEDHTNGDANSSYAPSMPDKSLTHAKPQNNFDLKKSSSSPKNTQKKISSNTKPVPKHVNSSNNKVDHAKDKASLNKKSKSLVHGMRSEGFKIEDVHLKILDDLPSSAVEMQVKEKFIKKLNRQEKVVEEIKQILKPYYTNKEINKDEYKEILRKAVPKICKNRTGDINPKKVKILIESYIRKMKHQRSKPTS